MLPPNSSGPRSVDSSRPAGESKSPDRVLVVVPAFNESGSLPRLIAELREECPTCDVVVIDDGSSDSTRETAAALTRVVALPCNLGIGGAVQTGLLIADRENYDFAVQVDGDGQHPPRELPRLLSAARENEFDLLVGSRFLNSGGFKSTITRRMGIRFFGVMLSGICRTKITDPTSGFRVFNRRAIRLSGISTPKISRSGIAGSRAPRRTSHRRNSCDDVGAHRRPFQHRRNKISDLHGESFARDFHEYFAQERSASVNQFRSNNLQQLQTSLTQDFMQEHGQAIVFFFTLAIFALVMALVLKRKITERFAILWMGSRSSCSSLRHSDFAISSKSRTSWEFPIPLCAFPDRDL